MRGRNLNLEHDGSPESAGRLEGRESPQDESADRLEGLVGLIHL